MYEKVAFIVLAAGSGTRFGSQKQFLDFLGKPIWRHIYDKILFFVPKENVVVVGVDILGGITRSRSVMCGLEYLKESKKSFDRVVIVEAARPLVTKEQLKNIIEDKHSSSTYALPLVNTIIKRDGTYLNREDYFSLSTPVAFDYVLFSNAYLSGRSFDYTDDTKIMYDFYGIKPHFLEGEENLIKITYKSDLSVLEMLYKKYQDWGF